MSIVSSAGGENMKIVDLSGVKQNKYVYGGLSGRKLGITYNGENYLLKFPGSLKNRNLRNINLSYSNSPVCEYIGSKIYRSIGIEVHDTFLGMISNKIIVACKDFCMPGEELQEFGKIKITYAQDFLRTGGELTDGTSTDLAEIEDVIKHHPVFENIKGIQEHFWNMFVVDALIGNADRNNGNWGIIVDAVSKEFKRIAPVYDNGGCLFNKWDDAKIREVLDTPSAVIERAYKGVVSIFESKGRRVNPFTFMQLLARNLPVIIAHRRRLDKMHWNIFGFIGLVFLISVSAGFSMGWGFARWQAARAETREWY